MDENLTFAGWFYDMRERFERLDDTERQLGEMRKAITAALDELDEAAPGENDPFIVAAQNILRTALKDGE